MPLCVCVQSYNRLSPEKIMINTLKIKKIELTLTFAIHIAFFKITIVEINKALCVAWETELALQHKRWARAAHLPF